MIVIMCCSVELEMNTYPDLRYPVQSGLSDLLEVDMQHSGRLRPSIRPATTCGTRFQTKASCFCAKLLGIRRTQQDSPK